MSADNWTTCPRCAIKHNERIMDAIKKADAAYGVLPVDEWKDLDANAREMSKEIPDQTFREDYDISGAEDGVVEISYSGKCTICDLCLKFKHEVPIEGIK